MKTKNLNIAALIIGGLFVSTIAFSQDGGLKIEGKVSNVNCFGSNDGGIDLNVTGGAAPYTFEWNNGTTSEDLSNLYGGTYIVTVTDANNNVAHEKFVLQRPKPMTIMVDISDQSEASLNDGSISSYVSGGVEPYNYTWSNGSTNAELNNLSVGEYALKVTDQKGCDLSMTVDVRMKKQDVLATPDEEIFTSVNNK